jgi:uncharacterized protein with HEPN domain
MKKNIRDYLLDMQTYLQDIRQFTDEQQADAFKADRKTQLAVILAFEVIGEIAKRLPDELINSQSGVDWRAVKGFRDILIHQYDVIDLDIVWDAIRQVPNVEATIQALLNTLENENN